MVNGLEPVVCSPHRVVQDLARCLDDVLVNDDPLSDPAGPFQIAKTNVDDVAKGLKDDNNLMIGCHHDKMYKGTINDCMGKNIETSVSNSNRKVNTAEGRIRNG